jgi:hypothetical protein
VWRTDAGTIDAQIVDDAEDDRDTYEEGDDELVAEVARLRAEVGVSS